MAGNDNDRREHVTVTCAWCGAVREVSTDKASRTGKNGFDVETICPDCEADFRSLSNGPKAMSVRTRPAAHHEHEGNVPSSEWFTPGGRRLRLAWLALSAALLVAACGAGRSHRAWTMPSPDGCFVQVWDGPEFRGDSEFINGPRRYEHLRELPGRLNWKGRIRSLRLGPNAYAVAWSDEGFQGRNLPLAANQPNQDRFATLPVDVGSLDVQCARSNTLLADTAAASR